MLPGFPASGTRKREACQKHGDMGGGGGGEGTHCREAALLILE